jgi:glycosyltransferase involved in cell wall biosynthesis
MVNDCAYVAETLLRYFPEEIKIRHIKRTRGLWDKTFGIAYKILRAKADLFHVHYALQDAYITLKTKKEPVIVHAHGSDCRTSLYDWKWGWIVRYNLKHASKVLVSAPDVLGNVREHRFDAEYIPIPVDLRVFNKKPLKEKGELILLSPFMSALRGTHKLILAFSELEKTYPHCKLLMINSGNMSLKQLIRNLKINNIEFIEPVPHEQMPALYEKADIVVSDLNIGALPTSSLEAMAVGRPVVQYIKEGVYSNSPPLLHPPVVSVQPTTQGIIDSMEKLMDIRLRRKIAELQYSYVKEHSAEKIAKRILEIYETLL